MINLTPHAISVLLNDGTTKVFEPSGTIARVSTVETVIGEVDGITVVILGDICREVL